MNLTEREPCLALGPKKLTACLTALSMNPKTYTSPSGRLCVFGKRADLRLAIEVWYELTETAKGAEGAKFGWAKVRDPIGVVRNLEFDYKILASRAKDIGISPERAQELSSERSRAYNDGAQYGQTVATMDTASEMNEWLDDWLGTLKINHKAQSAKRKAKELPPLMPVGDWIG